MLYREFSRLFCLVLALSCCPPLRAAAQVTSPSFVAGLPEDEAAIREVLAGSSEEDRADDIDWENAFGARFNRRDKLDAFMSKRLAPTLAGATRTPLEIKIRFIGPTLAVADVYFQTAGQVEPATGNTLPDRWIRTTSILEKNNGSWAEILVRVADLRQPWYQHFTTLPSPVSVPTSTLALYAGRYQATPQFTYEISLEGDRLAVKTPAGIGVAIPRSDSEFFYFGDRSVPGNYTFIKFSKAPDGTMTLTESGPRNDRPVMVKKIR